MGHSRRVIAGSYSTQSSVLYSDFTVRYNKVRNISLGCGACVQVDSRTLSSSVTRVREPHLGVRLVCPVLSLSSLRDLTVSNLNVLC